MSIEHKHQSPNAERAGRNRRRLTFVLILTGLYMVAEIVGGVVANSLALMSDAGHMLTDIAALILALMALWFSTRPVTPQKTYGYYRMEILAALANGAALLVISLIICYEAIIRIKQPLPVRGLEVMLIAIGGLVINGISAWLLNSASGENLNLRGAFLHVIGDALGSAGAIAAGVVIWLWGWMPADPIMSIAMCLLIVYGAWQLIRESTNILLEGTPSHINIRAVLESMHKVDGVQSVHDLHIWTISSGNEALSSHVTIENGASHKEVLIALQEKLRNEFHIFHQTIQIEEFEEYAGSTPRLYHIKSNCGYGGQENIDKNPKP